jgi:hypothetical protein
MDIVIEIIILVVFGFFTILYGLAICVLIDENKRFKKLLGDELDLKYLNWKIDEDKRKR